MQFTVLTEYHNHRLDLFLKEKLSHSRPDVQKMIAGGVVFVNGARAKKAGERVKNGDTIEVCESPASDQFETREAVDTGIPALAPQILKETLDYLVIDKPAGMLVHPTEARETGTLVDWLREQYRDIREVGEDENRPGIVHRLDKEASGVLVVAKTQPMYQHLKQQFQLRTVEKEYTVLVYGAIDKDHDTIDFLIDRSAGGRMVARPKIDLLKVKNVGKDQPGKEAKTEFLVDKRFVRFTLLTVRIHTGRTHQIRVHMFAYNHPVVGDELYVNRKLITKNEKRLGRLFLHAKRLCFSDLTGERVCVEAPLPQELVLFLKELT